MPPDAKPDTDIEATLDSWGTGSNVVTKLYNQANEVCLFYLFGFSLV